MDNRYGTFTLSISLLVSPLHAEPGALRQVCAFTHAVTSMQRMDPNTGIYASIQMRFPIIVPHSTRSPANWHLDMLSRTPCHHLLSIVVAIVHTRCWSAGQRTAAKANVNLYSGPAENRIGFANLLGLGLGVLNFLEQGQNYMDEEVTDTDPPADAIYDFVVIGAGTAGATVAARLSEVPGLKVLLIEAGQKENLLMDVPLLAHILQLSNDINWKYRTKSSDRYCLGMNDNRCNWPRGKVLGGSSVLNYMIATRGGAEDYDRWAELGNDGWAYKDVLRYFKKLETVDMPELRRDSAYHGTDGPLHISYANFHTPIARAFLQAGRELNYPIVDYNGERMIGFSYLQTTIMNGTRMSSNRAYLHPARRRANLHVSCESMVRRILTDGARKRAIGVEFVKYRRSRVVRARKEVIVCAGAIGSPQLLMLSGIGPAEHLAGLGIDVVKDAPVGDNLMDHVAYGGLTYIIDRPASIRMQDMLNLAHPYLSDFLMRRAGPITIPGGCEALAFIDTKQPDKRTGLPDIELLFIGGGFKGDIILPTTMGLKPQLCDIWNKYVEDFGWTVLPMLLRPKSRGRIRLLANDVNVKPEIVPNYYDDPEDVRTMINGIKASINVSETKAMRAFGSRLANDILPGCHRHPYDSDAYWECAVRTVSVTIYHYSGTCKMAPRGDPSAVVDPTLKVIGVEGLRVADASIMPEIISAHTNIPVYMIAEKLADMVKEEWGYLKRPQSRG